MLDAARGGSDNEGVGRREIEHALIVEDNASLQRSLRRTLCERFPSVVSALTCATAAEAMERQPPDLVVLDFDPHSCIPYEELLPKPLSEVSVYLGIEPLPEHPGVARLAKARGQSLPRVGPR